MFPRPYNILATIIAVITLLHGLSAITTQYRGNTQDPLNPGSCYYEELDLLVPRNETVFPKDHKDYCVKVYCREDYVLVVKHCDRTPQSIPLDCLTPYDFTKAYPDCCERVICYDRA